VSPRDLMPAQSFEVGARWAYLGAFLALGIAPESGVTLSLARLTTSRDALAEAIEAIANAARVWGPKPELCANAAATALYARRHEVEQEKRRGTQ